MEQQPKHVESLIALYEINYPNKWNLPVTVTKNMYALMFYCREFIYLI